MPDFIPFAAPGVPLPTDVPDVIGSCAAYGLFWSLLCVVIGVFVYLGTSSDSDRPALVWSAIHLAGLLVIGGLAVPALLPRTVVDVAAMRAQIQSQTGIALAGPDHPKIDDDWFGRGPIPASADPAFTSVPAVHQADGYRLNCTVGLTGNRSSWRTGDAVPQVDRFECRPELAADAPLGDGDQIPGTLDDPSAWNHDRALAMIGKGHKLTFEPSQSGWTGLRAVRDSDHQIVTCDVHLDTVKKVTTVREVVCTPTGSFKA